jgi:hypothetical protein
VATGGKRKPGDSRRQLFILRPGRANRAAEGGDAAGELVGLDPQGFRCGGEDFALADGHGREPAPPGRVQQSFAEEFAIGGVNQRVGSENARERGQRPAGSEQYATSFQGETLLPKLGFEFADCTSGEASCFGSDARYKRASLITGQSSGGMIRLAKFVDEDFDQMHALASQDHRLAPAHGQRNQRGPARVDTKSHCSALDGILRVS